MSYVDHGWRHGPGGTDPAPGSGRGGTNEVQIYLDTPDAAGNGYVALTTTLGFTAPRRAVPALDHVGATLSTWEGVIRVPQDYSSAGTIIVRMVSSNTAASKAARIYVSTSVVAAGAVMNTAYTDEAAVTVPVPTTANQAFDQAFTLTTTPVAGASLNVKVSRDASSGADTLTAFPLLIWELIFRYSA